MPALQQFTCACGCGKSWKALTNNRTFYSQRCAEKAGSTLPEPKRPRRVPAKPRPGGDFNVEWDRLVKAARERVQAINKARMDIAKMAIEACDIVRGGGGHWDKFQNQRTVKKFAEEIGLSYKVLHSWIRVKANVVDLLPPGEYDERNYGAATRTLEKLKLGDKSKPKKSPAVVRQIYQEEKERKADTHHVQKSMEYLLTVYNKFKNGQIEVKKCKREEVNEVILLCKKIMAEIQKQGFESPMLKVVK